MDEHSSSPMDNTELFLALTWPKQLNHYIPNQGTTAVQFHNKIDGNYAQSQNRETQPTHGESTMTQNEFEHPSPQNVDENNSNPICGLKPRPTKRGETIAPNKTVSTTLTWKERPNQSVRETKNGKRILCVRMPSK